MAIAVSLSEQTAIELALHALNADFCFYLDHGHTTALAELFTQDASYSHAERQSHGRAEIMRLFEQRNSAGSRVSRHIQSGLRLQIENQDIASGQSVCMTFAADVPPPVSHCSAHLVADFNDKYLRCSDGRWRFAKRHIERIFVAPENNGPVGGN